MLGSIGFQTDGPTGHSTKCKSSSSGTPHCSSSSSSIIIIIIITTHRARFIVCVSLSADIFTRRRTNSTSSLPRIRSDRRDDASSHSTPHRILKIKNKKMTKKKKNKNVFYVFASAALSRFYLCTTDDCGGCI